MKKLIAVILFVTFLSQFCNICNLYAQQKGFLQGKLSISNSYFYDIEKDDLYTGLLTSMFIFGNILDIHSGLITDFNDTTLVLAGGINIQELIKKIGGKYILPQSVQIGMFIAKNFREKIWFWGIFASKRLFSI